jgi:hypothetical protein
MGGARHSTPGVNARDIGAVRRQSRLSEICLIGESATQPHAPDLSPGGPPLGLMMPTIFLFYEIQELRINRC